MKVMRVFDGYTSLDKKIVVLRIVLSLALFSTFLISLQLWHNQRSLPTSPLFAGYEIPAKLNFVLLGILVLAVLSISFLKKPVISSIVSLIIGVFLISLDINRLQPEFYMFFALLLLFLFYYKNLISQEELLAGFKIVICSVYIWSGVHKLNEQYYESMYLWMIDPFIAGKENFLVDFFKVIGYITPYVEIGVGIGLLVLPFKKIFVFLSVCMHVFILVCIGPFGRDFNYIVFPWNIFMAATVVILFLNADSKAGSVNSYFKSFYTVSFLLFFSIAPMFNFFNLWDSYLSFDLYSGKYKEGIIFMKENVVKRLPADVRQHVEFTVEKQYMLVLTAWALKDINAPLYPEVRVFKNYRKYFIKFADDPNDIGLVLYQNGKYKVIK